MREKDWQGRIARLEGLEAALYNQDFLLTWERSRDELEATLLVAEGLEALWRANRPARVFEGGLAVSIFRDKSTRTRFSFASAATLLGLTPQELDEAKTQVAHGETVRETANMISFLTEAIGIRDDLFLHEGHRGMAEVAAAVEEGYRAGVLPQRPTVINLQCDLDHPTQTLSDLLHLSQIFGGLEALRGRKVAVTWAYSPSYGKPLSVPQGLIGLLPRFGVDVVLAHPPGYELLPEAVQRAAEFARAAGASFTQVDSMEAAFRDADVVYPKSWAPSRVMEQRTRLLRTGATAELAELEKECLAANARFQAWECNDRLMAVTREGKALYMHCLPADISGVSCERGEVSADVFERYRPATYRQAAHKPFIIAAMILLTRFPQPARVLAKLCQGRTARKMA